ncbi:hypothetical protein BSKO_02112 [Bryopsis sp. KO-2023]|nr:hypothetical protein BSKO_02112 [Bryopsis sp. KO-2023]
MNDRSAGAIAIGVGAGVALFAGWQVVKRSALSKAGVEDISVTSSKGGGVGTYEAKRAVDEYLQFHYGEPETVMPYKFRSEVAPGLNFVEKCANLIEKHTLALQDISGENGEPTVLDIGCSVGGVSFALARSFPHVLGIDYSQAFIDAAIVMKEEDSMHYASKIEGDIEEFHVARVPDGIEKCRVSFRLGDACNLPANMRPVDAILAANLLCRLPDPMLFLNRLPSLMKPKGCVVLVSPYSWLESWTPKPKWMGGCEDSDGKPLRSAEKLKAVMEELGFELVHEENVPFLIREHVRKFQLGISHATVWRRK